MSLHGHIHESPYRSGTIATRINGVQCINPGQNSGPRGQLRYVLLEVSQSTDALPVLKVVPGRGSHAVS